MDAGIEPLIAQSAVPAEELLGKAIATMAAREDENACAKKSGNSFFHDYKLLIFKCFVFSKNIRNNNTIC
jgi:hypothetical protein